jgi:hypothetical protein
MTVELLDIAPGSRNVITEAAGRRLRLLPLTLDQYHRMIETGILPEDASIELLEGMLVPKDRGDAGADTMVVGEQHAYVVNQLARLLVRLDRTRMYIQTQQPIVIAEAGGEPEPDAAIVLRPIDALGKPTAADVSCVIEVAGSSLERDRTTKLRHYARGGIPQYVIVNLVERIAEEYLQPNPSEGTYAKSVNAGIGESLRLHLEGEERLTVPVADLLPPAKSGAPRPRSHPRPARGCGPHAGSWRGGGR